MLTDQIREICRTVSDKTIELINILDQFIIAIYDSENREFNLLSTWVYKDGNLYSESKKSALECKIADIFNDVKEVKIYYKDDIVAMVKEGYYECKSNPPTSILCAPMIAGEKRIGFLLSKILNGHVSFKGRDKRILSTIANQTGFAINNAIIDDRLKSENEELEKINTAQRSVHDLGIKLTEGIQLGENEIAKLIKEHADKAMDTENM